MPCTFGYYERKCVSQHNKSIKDKKQTDAIQGITIVCYALYIKLKRYKGVFQKIIYAS